MRVTCDGCGAKYAIADERLQGRSVRVKCKKCGASIAVGALGAPGDDAVEPSWMVLLDDGEQRPVTPEQLAELYREGVVHGESYLWKEGMADWLPLSELDEAQRIVSGAAEPGVEVTAVPVTDMAVNASVERAKRAVVSNPNLDLFGEGGAQASAPRPSSSTSDATPLSSRAGPPRAGGDLTPRSARSAPLSQRSGALGAPVSQRAGALGAPASQSSGVLGAPVSQRLGGVASPLSSKGVEPPLSQREVSEAVFGASSVPSSRRAVGEAPPSSGGVVSSKRGADEGEAGGAALSGTRNDDSVLFSVATLGATKKAAPSPSSAAKAAQTPPPGVITSESEASGMIDMRILSTMHSGPAKKESAKTEQADDLMNMGFSGPLFGPSLASPLLAPPVEAPPPPPAPAVEPAPTSGGTVRDAEAPPSAAAPAASAARPKVPRWAAAVAAVAGLGLVGVIGVSALGPSSKDAEMTMKADEGATKARTASPPQAEAPKAEAPAAVEAPPPAEAPPAEAPKADESEGRAEAPKAEAPGRAEGATAPRAGEPRRHDDDAGKRRRDREEADRKEAERKAEQEKKAAESRKAEQDKKAAEGKAKAEAAAVAGPAGTDPFDRGAASASLSSAAGGINGCKKPDGPTGLGRVSVTFAPSGAVSNVVVEGPPFAGTPVGGCIAAKFRSAKVPAFAGPAMTIKKSFSIN